MAPPHNAEYLLPLILTPAPAEHQAVRLFLTTAIFSRLREEHKVTSHLQLPPLAWRFTFVLCCNIVILFFSSGAAFADSVLNFPRLAPDSSLLTGVAIVNPNSTDAKEIGARLELH